MIMTEYHQALDKKRFDTSLGIGDMEGSPPLEAS